MSMPISYEEMEGYCNEYKNRESESGNIVSVCATINGYHNFRTRPLVGLDMVLKCVREPENAFDYHAIKVVIPTLRELNPNILDLMVKEQPQMTVRNVAGATIGRVPASIAAIVSPFINSRRIIKAECTYLGSLSHGNGPLGDGPKLNCMYFFEVPKLDEKENLKQKLLAFHEGKFLLTLSDIDVVIC